MSATHGDDIGMRRVREPAGALPQAAWALDPTGDVASSEIAIDVEYLNLDSASLRDLVTHTDGAAGMRAAVLGIVGERGKMHNPRTGSGGMLVGRIAALGPDISGGAFAVGDEVATLVSLTATPLEIRDELEAWDGESEIVPVDARAIAPGPRTVIRLPVDLPTQLALSVLDVCGASAVTRRVLSRGMLTGTAARLLLLGGGKSAVLCSAAARQVGVTVQCVVPTEHEARRLRDLDVFDEVLVADATHPEEVRDAVEAAGPLPDVTIVCVNVQGCEHAALLATRDGGAIVYFSMATSFTAVALGAEAICRDLDLYIGSGYVPGHAESALDLVRADARARTFFEGIHPVQHTEEKP